MIKKVELKEKENLDSGLSDWLFLFALIKKVELKEKEILDTVTGFSCLP